MLPYLLAFAGGALTLLSPCILPVLPFVFARTGQPFLRGSLPLLFGMALSFAAVASLGAVAGDWAVQTHELGRVAALIALAVFALALLKPSLATWLAQPLVRLGERLLPVHHDTSWLASVAVGVATGLVWAPCAGPILGLILAGAALAGPSVQTSVLLLAYAAGAATALALLLRAGKGPLSMLRSHLGADGWPRRVLGGAMLASVLAVGAGLDTGVLARLSLDLGAGVEQHLLSVSLESIKPDAGDALATVKQATASNAATGHPLSIKVADTVSATPRSVPSTLPIESTAPSLDGAVNWLNSPPLSMEQLRGKVVLVNFWTYSCINCLRSLPHVRAWAKQYADQGLVVIGVHTPEFAFEKDAGNVQRALKDLNIDYPVAQDNNYGIWRAFHNQYWPALYVIDAEGRVRHHQFGEGGQARSEQVIQALLREAGGSSTPVAVVPPDTEGTGKEADMDNLHTPETYLGYQQARGFVSPGGLIPERIQRYTAGALRPNTWSLQGAWTARAEFVELGDEGGSITLRFHARDAHLVLGAAPGQVPLRFRLTIDGQPPGNDHGDDVGADGLGTIGAQRLYQLVRQRGAIDERTVEIQFLDAGAHAYAFTFG